MVPARSHRFLPKVRQGFPVFTAIHALHLSLLLPHPLQDLARISRETHRGSHVFLEHITFQLVSKTQTHRGPFGAPLPHPSPSFQRNGSLRFCHMSCSIRLWSIPLNLPFFYFSFVKCSQFQEIVIQNVGEVADFWLRRSCRCYSLRKPIMIAHVSNGCESARSQKFSYSRMYKPFSYWKKAPSRIIYYYTWFKLQDLQQGSSWLMQDSRSLNTDDGMMECLMN